MHKRVLFLVVVSFLIFTSGTVSFSQEIPTAAEVETQWLWGEVVSVDTRNNELAVKYLDYETEEEKEIVISINEQTVYENVNALSEITTQDAVSVDYVVDAKGKNIAKNISVEKAEVLLEPQEEVAPEETLPVGPSVE